MRYLKYLILLAALTVPLTYAQAQVSFGVQVGPSYGLYNAPPVCEYGYYPNYPYDCAPYGYWGPQWFVDGVFIGVGPWYNFYHLHPGFWGGYYGRFYGRGDWGRFGQFHGGNRGFGEVGREFHGGNPGFRADGREFRGGNQAFAGGQGFRSGDRGLGSRGFGGSAFHGGGSGGFRAGGEFHGGSGFHGGGGHGGRR